MENGIEASKVEELAGVVRWCNFVDPGGNPPAHTKTSPSIPSLDHPRPTPILSRNQNFGHIPRGVNLGIATHLQGRISGEN